MHTHGRSVRLLVVTPLLAVAALQLGGCSRRVAAVPPPPPGGVYLSTSAGAHFDQSVTLVDAAGEPISNIATFALGTGFRPSHNPQHMYIAAGERGYVWSDNGGETWRQVTTPLAAVGNVVVLENGILVAAGIDGANQGLVIRSNDGGVSWESTLTIPVDAQQGGPLIGSGGPLPTRVVSIAVDPFDPNRVYGGSNQGTIFIGEQSAKVWKRAHAIEGGLFGADRPSLGVTEIIPSPHTAGELLIITASQRLVRINADSTQEEIKIPKTVSTEPPSAFASGNLKKIHDVTYVAEFPESLFVGVEDGAVISKDRGVTFEQLPLPLDQFKAFSTGAIAASPSNASRLLVGVNNVMYRSEDGGNTWSTFPLATTAYGIVAISIDPTNASRVLVVMTPLSR